MSIEPRIHPASQHAQPGMTKPRGLFDSQTEDRDGVVKLGVDDQGKKLQLVDLADGSRVLQEQDLNSDAPFLIQGSAADDRLQ